MSALRRSRPSDRYNDPRIASQRWRYRADTWITHALDALAAARFIAALVILVALLAVMVGWLVAGLA